jgi:hypothetical protein
MMNKTTTKAGRRIDPSGWKREKREINKHLKADKGLLTELFLIVVLSYHMHRKGSHNVASRAQSISRVNKARRARERTQKQREANCHYKNNYDHQLRLLAYKFTHEEQQERKKLRIISHSAICFLLFASSLDKLIRVKILFGQ